VGVAVCVSWIWFRTRRLPDGKRILWMLVAAAPLGFVAIEAAGWSRNWPSTLDYLWRNADE